QRNVLEQWVDKDGVLAFQHCLDGCFSDLINVDGLRCFASISRHLGTNLARTDNQNIDASATQRLIEVDVETIGASLGCAVDKVRTTHAHARYVAHRHDGAMPLRLELLAQ